MESEKWKVKNFVLSTKFNLLDTKCKVKSMIFSTFHEIEQIMHYELCIMNLRYRSAANYRAAVIDNC